MVPCVVGELQNVGMNAKRRSKSHKYATTTSAADGFWERSPKLGGTLPTGFWERSPKLGGTLPKTALPLMTGR